jgi:hypothetical protein
MTIDITFRYSVAEPLSDVQHDANLNVIKTAIDALQAAGAIPNPLPVSMGGTGAQSASAALTALGAAPIASPAFTGSPTVPNVSAGDNSTKAANTAFVAQAVSTVTPPNPLPVNMGGTGAATAAGALTSLGAAPIASPALTGTPTAPTPANTDSSTRIATTAYVQAVAAGSPSGIGGTAVSDIDMNDFALVGGIIKHEDKSATSYTLADADVGKVLNFTTASTTVTLPKSAGAFKRGHVVYWRQGAVNLTFAAASGGQMMHPLSHTKGAGIGSRGSFVVAAINTGTDTITWDLQGLTTAP